MMYRNVPIISLLVAAIPILWLQGCAPDLDMEKPDEPRSVALFDPTTGQVPMPNVVLQDTNKNTLALPVLTPPGGESACASDEIVCDDECKPGEPDDPCISADQVFDGKLTAELKASMNKLSGFLPSSTITIPFSKPLDQDTLGEDNVLFMNILPVFMADKAPEVMKPGSQHDDQDNLGPGYWKLYYSAPQPKLVIKTKATAQSGGLPEPLQAGGQYAVALTDNVRGEDGKPLEPDLLTYLLRSRKPLVDAQKGKVLNFLLDSQVASGQLTFDDVVSLEKLRKVYDRIFGVMEKTMNIQREELALFFFFGVAANPQPKFGPKLGMSMTFPDGMNPYPNEYAGPVKFAKDKPVKIYFDPVPLEQNLKGDAFIRLYDITSGSPVPKARSLKWKPGDPSEVELAMGENGDEEFESGHRYAVVVTSIQSGFYTVRGTSYWGLVSAENQLVDEEGNIESQLLDSRLDVLVMLNAAGLVPRLPTEATAEDWKLANDTLKQTMAGLEAVRKGLKPVLDMFEEYDPTLSRENLALVFTFSIE